MSNNTLTLTKIKSIFEDIANRHLMINDYGWGPSYNIGNDRPLKLPYLWIEPVSTKVQTGAGNSQGVEYYTFTMFVMDKINKGDANYQDTSSDCDYISKTIFAELDQHPYYVDLDLSIDGTFDGQPAYESQDENSNGWMTTFTLKLPLRYSPCNDPIDPLMTYTISLASPGTNTYTITYFGPTGPAGATGAQGPPGATGSGGGGGEIINFNQIYKITSLRI